MNGKLAARLIIDLAMTILLLCAYAYRIIGDTAHEWIGISVSVLFFVHNIINRRWYKNIFKGAYTLRRTITAIVNITLVFTMTTLIVTGLMQSRTILSFLHLPGDMRLRQVHTAAAYWGLIVIAVHTGLHWGIILNAFRKMVRISGESRIRKIILRLIAFALVSFGVWSSFDRNMFSKLFLGFSFDYWPEKRPAILFFVFNFSIMGIYVSITHYLMKLISWYQSQHCQNKNERSV
jgi:uncharacterized membrane protein